MSLLTRLRRSPHEVDPTPAGEAQDPTHPTEPATPDEPAGAEQPAGADEPAAATKGGQPAEARRAGESVEPTAADGAGGTDAAGAPRGGGATADGGRGLRVGRVRRGLGWVLTVLAVGFVLFGLVAPDSYGTLHALSFLRLPLEALIAVPILLALPRRWARTLAVVLGVVLGLILILKVVDVGFTAVLARRFDLVVDWILLSDATGVVQDSIGTLGAVFAVIGACLLVLAILTLMIFAMLRLTTLVTAYHTATVRATAVLAVGWIALAAFGTQFAPGVPVASRADGSLITERVREVRLGLQAQSQFEAESTVDPYANTPGDQLFNGLHGKDVVIDFVESYGRYAIEDPTFAAPVDAQLTAATRELDAAGFGSRSAWLSSSTVGGASWLAHSTLLSGLYISNQRRYRSLVASNRLTLTSAFRKAGWKTVSVEPAITGNWPEGKFFGYEQEYDERNLGYQGSRFSYATMPDQYIYSVFQNKERQPGHKPVFAEITTVSSHSPWTPIPTMVDWDKVGNGSIFDDPANQHGGAPESIIGDPDKLRASYISSIQYSLDALVSYVKNYGGPNLVLVFLGDHQPAPVVTGADASRDVPVTIVAKDPKVLDRIASWHWTPGLRPATDAPETRMDTFRNRFMSTFGPADPAR